MALSTTELRDLGLAQLDSGRPRLDRLRTHWRGTQPAAYLSKADRDALDRRLGRLGVNYARLTVTALAERQRLRGFTLDGQPAAGIWSSFRDASGTELSAQIHTDRLLYGSAYVTVWADGTDDGGDGAPTLTGDSPFTMTTITDPATGDVLAALRRWSTADRADAVLMEPEGMTHWTDEGGGGVAWRKFRELDNPLGVVPVVPFVRRRSLSDDGCGSSVVADVLDLSDAVDKLLADAMVSSEYFVRPRRWATGLEIEVDDDGRPVDPFGQGRTLQSEDPDTRFGQLDGARLDGYSDLIATLTQQIGAVSALPAHYLGLHGDQPPNADSVRAAEAQLTMRAADENRAAARPWSRVAWLLDAVRSGRAVVPARRRDYGVRWDSPEINTPAQAADMAVKLRSIGVSLADVLDDPMRWEPERVADAVSRAREVGEP